MTVDAGTLQKLAVISFLPSAVCLPPPPTTAPSAAPLCFSTMN